MLKLLYEMEPGQYFHSFILKFMKHYHCDFAREIIPAMFVVSEQNAVGVSFPSRLVLQGHTGGADSWALTASASRAQLEFRVLF